MFADRPLARTIFHPFHHDMANTLTRQVVIALVLLVAGRAPAWADDVLPPAQALQKVVMDLKSAGSTGAAGVRFALTTNVKISGKGAAQWEYRYDPGQPEALQWTLLHPSAAEDAKLRGKLIEQHKKAEKKAKNPNAKTLDKKAMAPDQLVLARHLHEMVGHDAKFLRKEGDAYVFSYLPDLNFLAGPDNEQKSGHEKNQGGKRNKAMAEALRGEFAISQDGRRFVWVRQFAGHAFKPAPVAKIERFDLRTDFATAWPGGPLVQVRQDSHVSGSALFRNFDQHSVITYSEFEKR